MTKFTYSLVASAQDASNPTPVQTTFEEFAKSLREPRIRVKKDGPAIVLASFGSRPNPAGNLRWDGNVTEMTGFALDLDRGSSEEDIRNRLRGLAYVAHTTFSHSAETPKWRVIIPLKKPLDPSRVKTVFDKFNEKFDGKLDPACKNPSRLYYLPACPSERRSLFRHFAAEGRLFDPDSDLRHANEPRPKPPSDISAVLGGVPEGQRDDQLFRLACKLRASGMPRDEAERNVLVAASRCVPPFDPEDAKKKLASAWRYASSAMLTDLANSLRLVHQHFGEIRYLHKVKKWIYWNETRWLFDEDGQVLRLARAAAMSIYKEIAANPESAEPLLKHAKQSQQAARLEAMERLARTEDGVPILPDELDADPWLIGTPRGVVDLRTGSLREPRPEDFITKATRAEFDPDARCDRWLKFLREIMGGKEHLVEFLQRAIGYTLTGSTAERCLFFLYGSGANGKSTLLNVLQRVFGDYAMSTPAETLVTRRDRGVPNDIARMRGARLVATSEVEEGAALAEALVKKLTGGDVVTARFLFAEFFDFTPTFKIWLAANHKPRIHGDDYAIWDRIRLIPFVVRIERDRQDKDLLNKLCKEDSGILAWAVRGCIDWWANGLRPPPEVMLATAAYQSEMDTFDKWIRERCELDPNPLSLFEAAASELYEDYGRWSKENELWAVSSVKFADRLATRGIDKRRKQFGNFYIGIRLRASESGPGGM